MCFYLSLLLIYLYDRFYQHNEGERFPNSSIIRIYDNEGLDIGYTSDDPAFIERVYQITTQPGTRTVEVVNGVTVVKSQNEMGESTFNLLPIVKRERMSDFADLEGFDEEVGLILEAQEGQNISNSFKKTKRSLREKRIGAVKITNLSTGEEGVGDVDLEFDAVTIQFNVVDFRVELVPKDFDKSVLTVVDLEVSTGATLQNKSTRRLTLISQMNERGLVEIVPIPITIDDGELVPPELLDKGYNFNFSAKDSIRNLLERQLAQGIKFDFSSSIVGARRVSRVDAKLLELLKTLT